MNSSESMKGGSINNVLLKIRNENDLFSNIIKEFS